MRNALTDPHGSPFENVAQREVRQRVDFELRRVPEPYRTTLILRDLEELEYREIAKVLSVPEGTVKSRLNRGRAELAKVLKRNKVAI